MKKIFALSVMTSACAALTACVSDRAPAFEKSPLFPAGYSDGCQSAVESEKNFSTKLIRDEALFADDAGYRSGWRQGYSACRQSGDEGTTDGIFRGQADPSY
ncbi:hypothetical protein [Parvularcula sp. IMCC14364]|uniref:hypothetical protein n=1 Tax=Parvularcula sp. IMCC14364 TaxID=3067902 RepID=UPI00274187ED|nr:hypothetical protein [Parvularcula sp. IMCC14364]